MRLSKMKEPCTLEHKKMTIRCFLFIYSLARQAHVGDKAFSNPRMSLKESRVYTLVLLCWIFELLLVFGYTGCT